MNRHVYTPDDLIADRRARRQADWIVTPDEASSTFGAVALGVALACLLGAGVAVVNALHAHAGELLAMVAP